MLHSSYFGWKVPWPHYQVVLGRTEEFIHQVMFQRDGKPPYHFFTDYNNMELHLILLTEIDYIICWSECNPLLPNMLAIVNSITWKNDSLTKLTRGDIRLPIKKVGSSVSQKTPMQSQAKDSQTCSFTIARVSTSDTKDRTNTLPKWRTIQTWCMVSNVSYI